MSVQLSQAKAECFICGETFFQIDSDPERALTIVREAVEAHTKEKHP